MPARTLTVVPALMKGTAHTQRAVLYARVSSKDQEKEGFSIPAQQRLLREYAVKQGLIISEEFVDVETAKQSGRHAFTAMLAYLTKHRAACKTILVEKTDRLYRNLKDWTTLDDLGTTIHLVVEGRVIGPDSRSSDHLMHGIHVLMARNYIQNLGEETRKGMTEKARTGIYPSNAPIGYKNVDGPHDKRVIVPDPDTALLITELFDRFAAGRHSVKSLVRELNSEGQQLRGRKLYSSVVHQILRKRLYTGEFDWNGATYAGTHEPLVTRECWQRVQELLDARAKAKTRKMKHDFAYTGLVRCGHCGCLFVGELKKGKYIYYHCTGNHGKCPEPYTRQEILARQFADVLQDLVIPEPVLEWLSESMLRADRTEQATRAEVSKKFQTRCNQIQARIETMYLDKLDGRITQEFFDHHSAKWRSEQNGLMRKIRDLQTASPAPLDQTIDMLRLTSQASQLFLQQGAEEQRRLLQIVLDKATWRAGTLQTTLLEPFHSLRHSNRESYTKEKENPGSGRDLGIWLPDMDSNHD
ncbi:MAG TPA: recombinase family protein [Bryobacteraceae bacterium]|nr:recombinase family protein [Bryobacteraceae bacterium]